MHTYIYRLMYVSTHTQSFTIRGCEYHVENRVLMRGGLACIHIYTDSCMYLHTHRVSQSVGVSIMSKIGF